MNWNMTKFNYYKQTFFKKIFINQNIRFNVFLEHMRTLNLIIFIKSKKEMYNISLKYLF